MVEYIDLYKNFSFSLSVGIFFSFRVFSKRIKAVLLLTPPFSKNTMQVIWGKEVEEKNAGNLSIGFLFLDWKSQNMNVILLYELR